MDVWKCNLKVGARVEKRVNGQFSWQKKRISWECNDSLSLILAALPGEHLQMSDFHGVSDCLLGEIATVFVWGGGGCGFESYNHD